MKYIDVICGFAMGMLLAICGLPFTTWQFWVLMPAVVIWRLLPRAKP